MDQQTRESDRELWNPAIHWLLNIAPGELGASGNLAGTISSLERGCQATGVPNTDLYSNYQMGWCVGDSPADKWRRWAPVWFALPRQTQGVHLAHYMSRNDLPDTQRVAVDGAMGKLANAAMWVHEGEQLAKLIEACVNKGREGRGRIIAAAVKRTDAAVREAHRYFDAVAETAPGLALHDGGRIELKPVTALWATEYDRRRVEKCVKAPELAAAIAMGKACKKLCRAKKGQPPETRNAA